MTRKEDVMAAVAAAGKALEELFPDVQFRITAEGDDGESPAENGSHLGKLLDSLRIKAPEALKTPAAHVELFRKLNGQLAAACAEPRKENDDLDEAIDRMVQAIFTDDDENVECECHACADCDGCDHCDEDEVHAIPESECSMVNVYFGNNLEDICVQRCGSAGENKIAAALLLAALDAMPDWPDERWRDLLDTLEELAWMLEKAE